MYFFKRSFVTYLKKFLVFLLILFFFSIYLSYDNYKINHEAVIDDNSMKRLSDQYSESSLQQPMIFTSDGEGNPITLNAEHINDDDNKEITITKLYIEMRTYDNKDIKIHADHGIYLHDKKTIYLDGNVKIEMQDGTMMSSAISINYDKCLISSNQAVSIYTNDDTISAQGFEINYGKRNNIMLKGNVAANFLLDQDAR